MRGETSFERRRRQLARGNFSRAFNPELARVMRRTRLKLTR